MTGPVTPAAALEAFLASLYTSAEIRAAFLADPRGEAQRAGVDEAAAAALEHIDRVGLELAAQSFARKRSSRREVR